MKRYLQYVVFIHNFFVAGARSTEPSRRVGDGKQSPQQAFGQTEERQIRFAQGTLILIKNGQRIKTR